MALVNEHFLKLPGSYLFSDIAKKVNTFKITHPKQDIIRLGIGDVTQPLPKACIEAMHKAVEELASKDTFRGYGPEQGYDFLIEAIIKNDFAPRGIHFSPSEIFVNDGAKSDTGNIGDILRCLVIYSRKRWRSIRFSTTSSRIIHQILTSRVKRIPSKTSPRERI